MENQFTEIIDKKVFENYQQALIIDVQGDAIQKYVNNQNEFKFESQSSYVEYISNFQKSILLYYILYLLYNILYYKFYLIFLELFYDNY